jgi:ubiquinone/menaquinone biosynthesis C-methylase UbiE/ketosteroid isomerase-like protein
VNDTEEAEIRRLLEEWNRSLAAKDLEAAERLRGDHYHAVLPSGATLSWADELELIRSDETVFRDIAIHSFAVDRRGAEAVVRAEFYLDADYHGSPVNGLYNQELVLRKTAGAWRAVRSAVSERAFSEAEATEPPRSPTRARIARLLPPRVKRWLRRKARVVATGIPARFQNIAYLPYKPGEDYLLPMPAQRERGAALPIPPQELWLGYNYPSHGKLHVEKMLEVVTDSGFAFADGDRILDLGCGAGRMIRHLEPLAERCEIWGTDISAPHIFWCRENLSPPFHFATTTKVPHLPFEDRSFALIYCGSLFTHIDDLAEAWLLELRRILAPGGRLYVTIHDQHTMALFDEPPHSAAKIVQHIKSAPTFQAAKDGFGMFTMGRDNESQVFYSSEYLAKMFSGMFDIVSVTPEAYFYQTAYLLKRKEAPQAQGRASAQ